MENNFYTNITKEFSTKEIEKAIEMVKLRMAKDRERSYGFKSLPIKIELGL